MAIEVGGRWREVATGRVVVILAREVYGTGPAWRYEDEPRGWHYCCAEDFVLWGRFVPAGG